MKTHHRNPIRGYFYIAAATFLWGVAATLGRAAFTGKLLPGGHSLRAIDPLILSQSRTTFSFIVLGCALLALRGYRSLFVPAADFRRMVILGILGVAASNYFYYLAIQRTNVATAIILQYTAPVWVLFYAVLRKTQKPTLQRVAAVAMALCGIAVVIGVLGPNSGSVRLDSLGVVAAMIAAFSFAFYNVAGHDILTRYDRWIVLLYVILSASVFWIIANPPWKIVAAHYSSWQWLFLFIFSLISVLGPFSLYFAGLQHLEPTRAIVVSCLEPVFSIVLAAIALGEIMRPIQSLGVVLVLAATIVVQIPDRSAEEAVTIIEPIE